MRETERSKEEVKQAITSCQTFVLAIECVSVVATDTESGSVQVDGSARSVVRVSYVCLA